MTMRETEQDRLQRRGFDGLYHPDPAMQCGCFLHDLRPCGEVGTGCRGGHANAEGTGVFRPSVRRDSVTTATSQATSGRFIGLF